MTYKCNREMFKYKDSHGIERTMTENQMIDYINMNFGIKGKITKLLLV